MKNRIRFVPLLSLLVVLSLSIGYSAFNSVLHVSEASAVVRAQADIRVTGINVNSSSNGGLSNSEDYNVKSISTSAYLPNQNSTVTYTVEVTNFGNVRMEILDIFNLPSNLTYSIDNYTLDTLICDDNNTNKCTLGAVKTFTITIGYKDNGFDSSNTNYDLNIGFDFEEYNYYDLTINSTPNDADITLTTTEGTYTATGTITHRVKAGTSASYEVSKNLYVTVNESYTMTKEDHTINVNLSLLTYKITFDPNGGSVSPSSKDIVYNTQIGSLPTPTKNNGIFIGWFSDTPSRYNNSVSYKTDPLYYYADTYSDLYNAFGYDDNSLYTHYLNNGNSEGRRISQYIDSDILNSNTDITMYAGWVYKWEIFDKKKAWDETLVQAGKESGRINAGSYFAYKERSKLAEIANVDDQQLHFTEGHKSSIISPLPDHETYVFASNPDQIKAGSEGEYVVNHFCVITNSRVTFWAYITCDIYKVSNIRYVKGDNSYGYIYSTDINAYPSNGEVGDRWYVLQ